MVKAYKLHKILGISAGLILLVLSISGFFLNHNKWSFLYTTTFSNVPSHILHTQNRLFTSYYQEANNPKHIIVGGYRGLFETINGGNKFRKIASFQILAIIPYVDKLYIATSNGIYTYDHKQLKQVALDGEYITAMSIAKDKIVAVVDKQDLVVLDRNILKVLHKTQVYIDKKLLNKDICLSRFVRDLHYGRGLFDGNLSLFINDYGAIVLTFLALSGYIIWFFIKRKKYPKLVRKLIKLHANIFVIFAILPFTILAVTGIFLDHASALSQFMRSVTISHTILPPVYSTLKNDIWSVDYDGKIYRIGNRYGIYKSKNLKDWSFDNRGFAYKMIRKNNKLYISGMGAPNRVLENGKYKVLKNTPHMFRNVILQNNKVIYFSSMNYKDFKLPTFNNIALYTLLFSLHNGSFFSSWWVWINDFAAIILMLLSITGVIRWQALKSKR